MGRNAALALVASLKAAFPRQEILPATIEVYAAALEDLDEQAVKDAVAEIIRTSRWFPTVADIREIVVERECAFPSVTEAWELAAGETLLADLPPIVARAKRSLGDSYWWRTHDNPGVLRSSFVKAYAELRGDYVREAASGRAVLELTA